MNAGLGMTTALARGLPFEGKRVLVCGSSGGVGQAAVSLLLEGGAHVGLHYRSNATEADRLVGEYGADRLLPMQADLANREEARDVVARMVRHFGRIDGFLSTVGTQLRLEPFDSMADDTVDHTVQVELVGVITMLQAVLPAMVAAGGGQIVVVGSDSGKVGTTGEAVSAACRGGVIALVKSIAREYARANIRGNVVCPGPTDTALWESFMARDEFASKIAGAMARAIPLGRLGTAAEVAAVAVFLLSSGASFITGQAISVSGGLTMS